MGNTAIIRAMEYLVIGFGLTVLGLLMGSFAGASVWRLRARQVVEEKEDGETVDAKELKLLKKIAKISVKNDRSQCLHCGHQLAWYDLLPLVSWALLRGRCRYCRTWIGWFEPVIELSTAGLFALSYFFWPLPLWSPVSAVLLALWLIAAVGLVILFFYDAKWSYLPDKAMFPVIGVGVVAATVHIITAINPAEVFVSTAAACMILSGLYYALYMFSGGRWVGFGDVKLGLALALLLADYRLALLTLFLANVIGCFIVLPGMISHRLGRYSRVPFGPMLILGFVVAGLWGQSIIDWYLGLTFGL